jgi:aryl-alcohol dehydrogenase-like predicted oxidoreductase
MDWVIRKGYASYWGTSEWNADDIAYAHLICERYGFVKPVVEQPEYNLFIRDKM